MNPAMLLLIPAIIAVESGGDRYAVGDGGKGIGPMQIHQCVLDDVNAHWGTPYRRSDCFDTEKSARIFELYVRRWLPRESATQQDMAMLWHWGPSGMYSHGDDDGYWRRVADTISPIARFCGMQDAFGTGPDLELWTLCIRLGKHPVGSTVDRKTIEAAGYTLPLIPAVGMAGGVQLLTR